MGFSDIGNLIHIPNSYRFNCQQIMINEEESISNSYGIQTGAEQLDSKTFYLNILKFDPSIWSFKDNNLPTIIG